MTWHLRSGVVDGVAVNPLDGSRLSLRVDGDTAGGLSRVSEGVRDGAGLTLSGPDVSWSSPAESAVRELARPADGPAGTLGSRGPCVVGSGMTTVTEAPARMPGGRVVAVVVAVALVGIALAAVPSVVRLLDPPAVLLCPAIWPPATICAPAWHLAVTGAAMVVLAVAGLAAHRFLRRLEALPARAGVVGALALVAWVAWSAASVPQPYFAAWFTVFGPPAG